MILEIVLLSIHFAKRLWFKNSTYFHVQTEHFLWHWGFYTAVMHKNISFWTKWSGWRAVLPEINHRHSWDSWSCRNGIESVLLGWAPDLEAKAHQHESVRVHPWPLSGLILSHPDATIEGLDLDHYHGTPASYKVSQHAIQSETHTELSINLSHMVKVASPCHRTPAWYWTGGRLFAHHFTLDVVLL